MKLNVEIVLQDAGCWKSMENWDENSGVFWADIVWIEGLWQKIVNCTAAKISEYWAEIYEGEGHWKNIVRW